MADAIELKEEASKDLARIFNRVDTVEISPDVIYDAGGVAKEDRAVFKIKPADPITRDELKQIVLSFTIIQQEVCESNGVDISILADTPKLKKNATKAQRQAHMKMLEAIAITLRQIKAATEYEMSKAETRELLAKCVDGIDNYKELKKNELVESTKTKEEIIKHMPSILCVWLFDEIQKLSNLTTEEVLGL